MLKISTLILPLLRLCSRPSRFQNRRHSIYSNPLIYLPYRKHPSSPRDENSNEGPFSQFLVSAFLHIVLNLSLHHFEGYCWMHVLLKCWEKNAFNCQKIGSLKRKLLKSGEHKKLDCARKFVLCHRFFSSRFVLFGNSMPCQTRLRTLSLIL